MARQRARNVMEYLDSAPTGWRGSPIFERDAQEVRAGLLRIINAAEEMLRL